MWSLYFLPLFSVAPRDKHQHRGNPGYSNRCPGARNLHLVCHKKAEWSLENHTVGLGETKPSLVLNRWAASRARWWSLLHMCRVYCQHHKFCLNHSICPVNWGRRKHSPNKKFYQKGKETILSSFLLPNYFSGTYVAGVAGIAAILNFFQIY